MNRFCMKEAAESKNASLLTSSCRPFPKKAQELIADVLTPQSNLNI